MPRPDKRRPRPWSLSAFVVAYVVTAVYWTVFVAEGRATSLAWVAALPAVHLLWRGSRPAMIASAAVLAAFAVVAVIEVDMAMAPGGHHPAVHVVEATLLAGMLVLLLLPPSRRFYDPDAPDDAEPR